MRRYLAGHRTDVIVVAEEWIDKLGTNPAALDAAVTALEPYSRRVIVIGQIPIAPNDSTREAIRNGSRPPFRETPQATTQRLAVAPNVDKLAGGNVTVIDVADQFVHPDGDMYLLGPDRRLTYQDQRHLSDTGAELVHGRLNAAITASMPKARARTGVPSP